MRKIIVIVMHRSGNNCTGKASYFALRSMRKIASQQYRNQVSIVLVVVVMIVIVVHRSGSNSTSKASHFALRSMRKVVAIVAVVMIVWVRMELIVAGSALDTKPSNLGH